jgi:hypothetical protein
VTLNVYSHVFRDKGKKAADAIEAVLKRSAVPVRCLFRILLPWRQH